MGRVERGWECTGKDEREGESTDGWAEAARSNASEVESRRRDNRGAEVGGDLPRTDPTSRRRGPMRVRSSAVGAIEERS